MYILRVCAYKRVSVNFCVQCFSAKTEKKKKGGKKLVERIHGERTSGLLS